MTKKYTNYDENFRRIFLYFLKDRKTKLKKLIFLSLL